MDVEGLGTIQHIWITTTAETARFQILRFYWDDETEPSVEVPIGDFFCNGWGGKTNVMSIPMFT